MTPDTELYLGSPGSGKTATLLGIVEHELDHGTPPDRIGYVAFTRRAAEEASKRAEVGFSLSPKQLPYFRTIHSLCFRALGLAKSDVLEGRKLIEFGDWVGFKVSGKTSLEEGDAFGYAIGDRCLFVENLARVRGVALREQFDALSEPGVTWTQVEFVARGLAEYKRARGLHDFTDMLSAFSSSDWDARLEVLLVDEAQDLSMLQWRVVTKLARGCRRVVVVGDEDQAIYRWAGAAVAHFTGLQGRVNVLGQSWRVPAAAQGLALDLLTRVTDRRPKTWAPKPGVAGEVARVARLDDVDFEAGDDVLVLARNSCFLRDDAAKMLESSGVLYEWRGASSIRRTLIDAVLAWERLRRGDRVPVSAVELVYDQMSAGQGYVRGHKKLPYWVDRDAEVGVDDLRASGGLLTDLVWFEAFTRVSRAEVRYMQRALQRGERVTERPRVRLSTLHGSKGGEARHVVLLRDQAWRSYREATLSPEDEARCFYVGVTRTMDRLTIVEPQTRRSYDV